MRNTLHLFLLFFFAIFLSSCSKTATLPESTLKGYSPQKVLDLAGEQYSAYNYDNALYYYSMMEKLFTGQNDEEQLALVWAQYETGFIYYQQGKYKEALPYFERVISMKSPSPAPAILATQMRDRTVQKISSKK